MRTQINEFHFKPEYEPTPIGLSISQGFTGLYIRFRDTENNITLVRVPKEYAFIIDESKFTVEYINVDEP